MSSPDVGKAGGRSPSRGACRVLVLNGPNLGHLGRRKPEIYGRSTLDEVVDEVREMGRWLGVEVEAYQSNHEGDIVDRVLAASSVGFDGVIVNAGALTHYSLALADAIEASGLPCVEVHLSNVMNRESFRRVSVIAPVTVGQVTGFGKDSYCLALLAVAALVRKKGVSRVVAEAKPPEA